MSSDKEAERERAVVITGATRGLGKSLALTFAQAGYEVIGVYRSETGAAQILEAEFHERGYEGTLIRQDITEDGEWAVFDGAVKKSGHKHLTLIANASAPFIPKPYHLIDWSEFSAQLDANVKGTHLTLKRLLPLMARARAGNFVSVLTVALDAMPKGFAAYVTAKSALLGLTRAVAAEYSQRGLRVFSVSPGFMETALTESWSEHLKASIQSPGRVMREPAEVAASIHRLIENPEVRGQGENYSLEEV